jgi:hypothetical protein
MSTESDDPPRGTPPPPPPPGSPPRGAPPPDAVAPPPSPPRRRLLPRLVRGCAVALLALVVALLAALVALDRPRPEGREGDDADRLARRMESAVDAGAWARTGAVRWTFVGLHALLWDRQRGLARVRWSADVEVLLHAGRPEGLALRAGQPVPGPAGQALVDQAHAIWTNDAYWLTAMLKTFDPGARRAIVEPAAPIDPTGRSRELLVSYDTGGLTPGDAYLWRLDPTTGRPAAWRMWVSVLPVGGLEATWDGWTQLSTGAWVSTRHSILGLPLLTLTDVAGAPTLADLEPGPDPFAALVGR